MIFISNEINQLNMALKGENMAIESFDHYIQDAESCEIKKLFQEVQDRHRDHVVRLAKRIQDMGGNPANSSGMIGVMAEIKYKLGSRRYVDNDVLKTAIEGEELGVESYNKIISLTEDTDNRNLLYNLKEENELLITKLQ